MMSYFCSVQNKFITLIAAAVLLLFVISCSKPTDTQQNKNVKAMVKGAVVTPLEKAQVYVYSAGMDLRGPPLATIDTAELTGSFSVELPAGKYFFVARKRISEDAMGPVLPGDYKSETIGPIEIKESGEMKLDLTAFRKIGDIKENIVSETKTNTSFSGTIYDSDGNTIAGVRALVYDHIQMSERPKIISEKTGPDGKYTVYLKEGGTYYLCARDKFGGAPVVGDLYGRYDQGTIDPSGVILKTGEHLTGVDMTVHKVW